MFILGDLSTVQDTNNAYFFSYFGIACAVVFSNLGSAYGTAKAGLGVCSIGVIKPDLIVKSIVPVVMAGILGIYGLIMCVLLNGKIKSQDQGYTFDIALSHLGAGLCNGLSAFAAGIAVGIVGDSGIRANAQQDQVFVGMILILIFAEALGLYGLIVAIMMAKG